MSSVRRDLRKFNERYEDGGSIERLVRIFRPSFRFRMLVDGSWSLRPSAAVQPDRESLVRSVMRNVTSRMRSRVGSEYGSEFARCPAAVLSDGGSREYQSPEGGNPAALGRSQSLLLTATACGGARGPHETSTLGSRMLRLGRMRTHFLSDGRDEGSGEAFRLMIS